MRLLDSDRRHERGDVIGEQFGRISAVRLVALPRPARIERNAGEMPGVFRDLEEVASVVGGEIRDESSGSPDP